MGIEKTKALTIRFRQPLGKEAHRIPVPGSRKVKGGAGSRGSIFQVERVMYRSSMRSQEQYYY